MGRPTKKEINLSKESMLSLMQEIYNEVVEQRNTAIRIQNKMLTMMKEPEDINYKFTAILIIAMCLLAFFGGPGQ